MKQQQANSVKPPEQVVNWPLIICQYLALPLELLLHNVLSFGVRSVGPRAVPALLAMFFFVASHPNDNCQPLERFMVVIIALSVIAHISALIRRWRGARTHTRYNGRPYVLRLLSRWNETTIKRLEPIAAFLVGFGIHHFNHPLGAFVMTSAVGFAFSVGVAYGVFSTRSMDMNDAIIEQTLVVENARETRPL